MSEEELKQEYCKYCDQFISCKDCEYENINNCHLNFAYNKGQRNMQEFIENKCKELGIDSSIFF